jgi:hypothetical protein
MSTLFAVGTIAAVGASVGGTRDGISTIACVGIVVGLSVHPAIKISEINRRIIGYFLNIMDIVTYTVNGFNICYIIII